MFSIDRLDDIWAHEIELFDGSYGKPEPVFETGDDHHIEPRIQNYNLKLYPENPFNELNDADAPDSRFIELDLQTGEIKINPK